LAKIKELFDQGAPEGCSKQGKIWLPWAALESARGFIIYVLRTYTSMIPYLKGLHLTIDSWRPNRDDDGWRMTSGYEPKVDEGDNTLYAPPLVKAVTRLRGDLQALGELTESAAAPTVQVRLTATAAAGFMFGDASGVGFGQSLWFLAQKDVDVFYGLWNREAAGNSSNWREFYNQVLGVERGIENGKIPEGTEIFLFTDNFVTERAFHRGTSKSKTLFDLVLRLDKLEMERKLFIHLIWVAGTQMIEQRTDGASQGDLSNGVMTGKDMLEFIPLDQEVDAQEPELRHWFGEAAGGDWVTLEPQDWFHNVHTQNGNFLWCPAPAIADVALEQLCETRHTRPWNAHIFLCPALMTSRWRKRLSKVADAMFTVPV
jgi:hypothetical protein